MVFVLRLPYKALEPGPFGLLRLEQQRFPFESGFEKKDPRTRADASDTHDLVRDVGEYEVVEQVTPVRLQRVTIIRHE